MITKFDSKEIAKAALLLGLAAYFAYNIVSGNVTNYINARFIWLSYLAAAILALFGIISAYVAMQPRDGAALRENHINTRWGFLAIAAFPLLIGVLLPSRPLGAEAVNGSISLSVGSFGVAQAGQKDPLQRNVLDWLRVFSQTATASNFDQQAADVIGFIYREPTFPPDHFMVARFTVSCCVADAGAIGMPVYWPDAEQFADGEWVQVRGLFQAGVFRDTTMPILQAETIALVAEPEHPYLYP